MDLGEAIYVSYDLLNLVDDWRTFLVVTQKYDHYANLGGGCYFLKGVISTREFKGDNFFDTDNGSKCVVHEYPFDGVLITPHL